MKKKNKIIALLTAAGSGTRMKQDIPKQFMHIENKPLIVHTMEAFQTHPMVDAIIVVCLDGWHEILKAYAKQFNIDKLLYVVNGGATGQESIKNGLDELKKHYSNDDIVIVHDGNRGLVSHEVISDALSTYYQYGSAVAVIPCTEAVFEKAENGSYKEISRDNVFRTQTPHVYSLEKMLWAHDMAAKKNITNTTATCSLMNILGEETHFSKGSEKNIKVTHVEDIQLFKALLNTETDSWIK